MTRKGGKIGLYLDLKTNDSVALVEKKEHTYSDVLRFAQLARWAISFRRDQSPFVQSFFGNK